MSKENPHYDDDLPDDHPRRVETCDIDEIETTSLRELAQQWVENGRAVEAGHQMPGDYVFDIETGVSVYKHAGKYVADDGRNRDSRFDSPRDAVQMALGYFGQAQTDGDGYGRNG